MFQHASSPITPTAIPVLAPVFVYSVLAGTDPAQNHIFLVGYFSDKEFPSDLSGKFSTAAGKRHTAESRQGRTEHLVSH